MSAGPSTTVECGGRAGLETSLETRKRIHSFQRGRRKNGAVRKKRGGWLAKEEHLLLCRPH